MVIYSFICVLQVHSSAVEEHWNRFLCDADISLIYRRTKFTADFKLYLKTRKGDCKFSCIWQHEGEILSLLVPYNSWLVCMYYGTMNVLADNWLVMFGGCSYLVIIQCLCWHRFLVPVCRWKINRRWSVIAAGVKQSNSILIVRNRQYTVLEGSVYTRGDTLHMGRATVLKHYWMGASILEEILSIWGGPLY